MRLLPLFLLLASSLASGTVYAQSANPDSDEPESLELFDSDAETTALGWSRFHLALGYTWLDADGSFDVEGPNGNRVTVIDLDRLGVDDKDGSIWATMTWRARSSRWGGWFGYWDFSGAGNRIWETELETGDGLLVPVGASVATEISTKWYIVEATYSFVRKENWDAGIGVGAHVVDLETTLAVGAQVGDEQASRSIVELDTLAPLPNVMGYVHWRFADRWHLTARYGWFGLSYDKYDGQMNNFHSMLRYKLSERWAVEAGYQFVKLDVDVNEDAWIGYFDMDFDGPIAVVRFNF